MSGFPGGYEDAALERQLEDEFRRRQQVAMQQHGQPPPGVPQAAPFPGMGRAARPPMDAYGHMGLMPPDATSPYYRPPPPNAAMPPHAAPPPPMGPQGATTPYARAVSAGHPYMGMDASQAGRPPPVYTGGPPPDHTTPSGSLTQLYASHQHQKQQAIQKAVTANYAAAYGGPPSNSASPTAMAPAPMFDSRGYPQPGMAPPPAGPSPSPIQQPPPGSGYAPPSASPVEHAPQPPHHPHGMPPQGPPPLGMAPPHQPGHGPPVDAQTAQEIAIMQEAFNRERKNQLKRHGSLAFTSRALRLPPPTKTNGGKKKDTAILSKDKDGKTVVEDRGATWYMGCVPLGVDDDKYWLSELQVFLRANFAEAFGATEEDIAAPMHGRNKPIALGQVGIRCMHCKNDNPAERGQQATSYPSLISGIYNSVQQMLRLHLDCCLSMPADVRQKIEQLKLSCSSRGGRKQYWVDSAKRLGLVDTPHGIHFQRDPTGPLPPLTGPSVNSKENRKKKLAPPKPKKPKPPKPAEEQQAEPEQPPLPPVDARPLVFPEDQPLISDYLYLTLEQMAPCNLMEADRVGCYKTRKVGFPGLACKHCVGQAGCGRYFPASEASLSQTTTSQTIMNHVRNCRRCPIEIRENLEIMKRNRMGPDGKRSEKPKHGGRKVFFHRLWCRIQDIPFEEGKGETKESKRKKSKKASRRRKARDSDADEETEEEGSEEEDDDAASSSEESASGEESHDEGDESGSPLSKKSAPWYDGCVRLTKADDPHWLSEIDVYARSELVEVFSLGAKHGAELEGYGGRKQPAEGQVGIRCVYCKTLSPDEKPNGCLAFPDALSGIHTKVSDMLRLHFPGCPMIPPEQRETFKSLRNFGAKVATDDAQQYWVDTARDIGLANIPPAGSSAIGAWGITFRRDPLQPSPADEMDLGQVTTSDESGANGLGKNSLVRWEDRGLCTDQTMLLMLQVRPCRFEKSDRRGGPSSRGRDRAMGYPGLACVHCSGRNHMGRYFPVSAKNLTDSTVNSLQAHIASCSRCPEHIKASLAYLGHRSVLQKAELSPGWKKTYFQKIWSRLHVEREWRAVDEDDDIAAASVVALEDVSPLPAQLPVAAAVDPAAAQGFAAAAGGEVGSDGEEKEELGDHMNALIKAAAIWLTEQDAVADPNKPKGARGRAPPTGKRQAADAAAAAAAAAAGPARASRSASASGLPTKRRRVHF